MIRPPKEQKNKGVFRKNVEAIKELFRLARLSRPLDSPHIEQTPNGWRLKDQGGGGGGYTPPFHPTVTPQSSGNNKDLSIGTGWVKLPSMVDSYSSSDIGDIPRRHQHPFKPKIGTTEIDDDSGGAFPVLQLTAGETNKIYLQIGLEIATIALGGTDYSGGTLTDGMALDIEDTAGPDNYTIQGVLRANLIHYHHETSNTREFKVYTSGSPVPAVDQTDTMYIYAGYYTLNSDGTTSDSEWYLKENITPPTPWHFQGANDTGSNPNASTA